MLGVQPRSPWGSPIQYPPSVPQAPGPGPGQVDTWASDLTTAALFCIWRKGTSSPSPRGPCDSWQEKPLQGWGAADLSSWR